MFGDRQVPWLGLIAAATLALFMVVAFRGADWSRDTVNRLILWPIMDMLRLAR
jgi:hypothetical protein